MRRPQPVRAAGLDLVDVERLGLALRRTRGGLERRVFTGEERDDAAEHPAGRHAGLAALFGVKESTVKLLGGLPPGGRFSDIHVGAAGRDGRRPVHVGGTLAEQCAWTRDTTLVAGTRTTSERVALAWAVALETGSPGGAYR